MVIRKTPKVSESSNTRPAVTSPVPSATDPAEKGKIPPYTVNRGEIHRRSSCCGVPILSALFGTLYYCCLQRGHRENVTGGCERWGIYCLQSSNSIHASLLCVHRSSVAARLSGHLSDFDHVICILSRPSGIHSLFLAFGRKNIEQRSQLFTFSCRSHYLATIAYT